MNNVLILTNKQNAHFQRAENDGKVVLADIYNPRLINKYLRHLPFFASFSLGSWKKTLNEYHTIIVFDSLLTRHSLYSIAKLCKDKRFILFFRNKATKKKLKWNFARIESKGAEIWSYNLSDCRKYGLKYHSDPPDDQLLESYKTRNYPEFDMVFLGDNKGRENYLLNVIKICAENKLSSYLYVIHGDNIPNNRCVANAYMKYTDYLDLLCNSKSVLDIVNEDNWGLTYRPFEAMFLKKKLITNYSDIIQYDFYNPSNIFLLGIDDITQLKDFLNSSYIDVDNSITDAYRTQNWLKGFLLNEE